MNLLKTNPIKDFSSFSEFSNYHLPLIESALTNSIQAVDDERSCLTDAIRHSLLDAGKRIRPLLVIASHSLFSSDVSSILPLACSSEMIHTYSLIHDDLPSMDNDDFRRGKPTSHVKFGEDIAILTGDALNTIAFEILSQENQPFKAEPLLRVVHLLSQLSGIHGLVGGQVLDIKSSNSAKDIQALKSIHHKKTGALIKFCIVAPALLHEADEILIKQLEKLSTHFGLLYQITDDILDVVGDKETLGKNPGKDHLLNKLTYTSLLGLEVAKKRAYEEVQKSESILDQLEQTYSLSAQCLRHILYFILNRTS